MKSENNPSNKLSTKQELCFLGAGLFAIRLVLVFSFYYYYFHLPFIIPTIVLFLPIVFFVIYIHDKDENIRLERLSHCKYSWLCSYYLRYEPEPPINPQIDINHIKPQLRSGHILLRRNTYYLDELIFSQHGFFTHVGICERANLDTEPKVWHVTSKSGVDCSSFEDFCRCKDIAVLRFSLEMNKEDMKMIGKDNKITEEECTEIEKFIMDHLPIETNDSGLTNKELYIFRQVRSAINSENFSFETMKEKLDELKYTEIILQRASSLKGYKYDWKFDFKKFDTFSCIEYVWCSFKSLTPLHRIKTEDFEFFNRVKMPVIIPDVFIKNPFFGFVCSSIPGIETKQQLIKYATPGWWRVWAFGLNILMWDAIILYGSLHSLNFLIYFIATFIIIKLIALIISQVNILKIQKIFTR